MTRTHTPGPWIVTTGFHPAVWLIDSSKDGAITEVRPIRDSATNKANANLIAAAPELLAVLGEIVSMYERGYVQGVSSATGGAFLDSILSARAAIAKAKGI